MRSSLRYFIVTKYSPCAPKWYRDWDLDLGLTVQKLNDWFRNKTCEWPVDGGQCGVFSRSDTTTTATTTTTTKLTSPLTSAPEDRQPPLSLARTDPVFRIPDDYIYFDEDDIRPVPDPDLTKPLPVRFPTNKDTSASSTSTIANIQPRTKQTSSTSLRSTKPPSITTTTTPIFVETETNRSFPRSLFQEEGNSDNSIDFGQTFASKCMDIEILV